MALTYGVHAYNLVMPVQPNRQERLHLRLSAVDDALIRAAAQAEQVSITEFVLQAARRSATETLADRLHVVLDAETWDALDARVAEPGRRRREVAELFDRTSPLTG
jgi:uncharacterized protein (DUF1778 family)